MCHILDSCLRNICFGFSAALSSFGLHRHKKNGVRMAVPMSVSKTHGRAVAPVTRAVSTVGHGVFSPRRASGTTGRETALARGAGPEQPRQGRLSYSPPPAGWRYSSCLFNRKKAMPSVTKQLPPRSPQTGPPQEGLPLPAPMDSTMRQEPVLTGQSAATRSPGRGYPAGPLWTFADPRGPQCLCLGTGGSCHVGRGSEPSSPPSVSQRELPGCIHSALSWGTWKTRRGLVPGWQGGQREPVGGQVPGGQEAWLGVRLGGSQGWVLFSGVLRPSNF